MMQHTVALCQTSRVVFKRATCSFLDCPIAQERAHQLASFFVRSVLFRFTVDLMVYGFTNGLGGNSVSVFCCLGFGFPFCSKPLSHH